MSITTKSIRNVAFVGHGQTGKTTLVENILYNGNAIPKPESVENGKTISDYTPEEIERKISIHTSLSHIIWNDKKINLLDTPGSGDFIGEVVLSFRTAESAVVLVGADTGVQIGTIRIWRRLDNRNMPRFIFINKMGKEHADFDKTLADLTDKFKVNFVPVVIPMGNASGFKGVINVLSQKAYVQQNGTKTVPSAIPADMADRVEEIRMDLIEAAAEGNDELMEKYLEAETLSDEDIYLGLAESFKLNKFVPVICGSALQNCGIESLLDIISQITPSPFNQEEEGTKKGEPVKVKITSDGPFSSFIFKTTIDQFSGKLSFIKVITGSLKIDSEVINAKNQHKEKITKLYTCIGKKLEDTAELVAGDLGILAKLDSPHTMDSLCAADNLTLYKALGLPQPPHAVAINAESKKDEDKMNQLLQRESEQDPTFRIHYDKETKETVISAMGELQLAIILDKVKNKQKINVETRIPRVAYRETITKPSGAEYQHKKQTGGHGQYAKVVLEIKPIERGQHFSFVNAIFGGAVSKGYIPGVEKGILEGMEAGILAGYPVVDIEAKIVDGKEHPVDSSEMSFKLASRGALRAAMEKAGPVLLEPVMSLEVFVDDQYLGDVLSDLSSRRGRVQGQDALGGGIMSVKAQVPQAELLRYSIDLKSITSGTASFEMEFDHYSPISGKIADDVIKTAKAASTQEE